MCGVAGFFAIQSSMATERMKGILEPMISTLQHRGPDGTGVWIDADAGIALGHRRLAIVDLSPNGSQPMRSSSGRYCITYNGEIYNFRQLRGELERLGCSFRGHSDTEVMLAAIDTWGVEPAVERFIGMFAFALWDRQERGLWLVRDRLGEKPLYYCWLGQTLVFASELKALLAHPEWCGEIDRDALALQMRYGYIPAPYSIYKGVYKLPPARILSISSNLHDVQRKFSPHLSSSNQFAIYPRSYWSLKSLAENTLNDSPVESESDAIKELDYLLRSAIRGQMVADVPVGAFLSGGIDSSTVVALMQAESSLPVKTFTIGFTEKAYDEARHASEIARYLGTDHTELYVTGKEALETIPNLPSYYDEPFSDPSQIPTFLVSKMARSHVTVCLSGDGGDELFAGYTRYLWTKSIWDKVGWLPTCAKQVLASAISSVSTERWDSFYNILEPLLPISAQQRQPGDKLHKLSDMLRQDNITEMYRDLMSYWKEPTSLVIDSNELPTAISASNWLANCPDIIHQMLYWDLELYLPNDNLVKVDRASMAVSLETRLPLLDHRVAEFAWRVPLSMKVRKSQGKWLVRQLLGQYVPARLFERPKTGFSVPIGEWLRGPLRDWAEDLLSPDKLSEEGFFEPAVVRQTWLEHLSRKRNLQACLWAVLMFQAWHAAYKNGVR